MPEIDLGSFEPIPVPTSDSFSDVLVRHFEPWLTEDLQQYLQAIAAMFEDVELLAFDTDTDEGWTILFDPDRTPENALDYLAQYVGERLPDGISDDAAREWIKDAPNQRRGTPRSVFLAAQRSLTGGRLVSMQERYGAVDVVAIRTNVSQTPNPAQTQLDILTVLPADVVLDYTTVTGRTWDDVEVATWTATKVKTWSEAGSGLTGYDQYQRPQ